MLGRTAAYGSGVLQPQRHLPGQPATRSSIRICRVDMREERYRRCFLGGRKFTYQSLYYWSASTFSDVVMNHCIDEKPSQLYNSVAFSAIQAKNSQAKFCLFFILFFSKSKPIQMESGKWNCTFQCGTERHKTSLPHFVSVVLLQYSAGYLFEDLTPDE